ncbi:MAG: glycosyltransferase family 8 protein [Roseobacter sp.]|nr:glycosyltransferase family 8 protein [Roseobacter sp.]
MTQQSAPGPQVTSNKPAQFRKAVVFCCDQNYLPFAGHAAAQVHDLHPNRDFDICLCFGTQKINMPASLDYLDLRLCHIDVGKAFEGLRLDDGKTHDVYLRLALPDAFSDEYDRILYLDSDIFVQGGDFSALLDIDMGDHALAAVRDNVQWRTPSKQNKRNTLPGLKPAAYFNAGVALMDIPACTRTDLLAHCTRFGRLHAKQLTRHDQNLLNAYFNGNWAEISPMWNWQFSWAARLFATLYSPNIVHFIGPVKPWKDPLGELEPRFATSMRRFARQHFPHFTFDKTPRGQLVPNGRRVTRMLLKHLISARKMTRYLARFPTEMTIHL